jgi:hypothetical protein
VLLHNLLQRAKTDAFEGLEWDNPDRPEARNLLTIYQCVTGEGRSAPQATAGAICGTNRALPVGVIRSDLKSTLRLVSVLQSVDAVNALNISGVLFADQPLPLLSPLAH